MPLQRFIRSLRTRLVVRLDQYLGWPPSIQIPVLIVLTFLLVALWGELWASTTDHSFRQGLWFAVTRFMDGGTMANDVGRWPRFLALGVTTTGVLVVSFLTGAFASKLGERIADLRSGRSPIIASNHVLVLGFDAKVPLLIRELARSHQRLDVVVLAQEEKVRLEAELRPRRLIDRARLKVIARTGDPRTEEVLLRMCADRARSIVLITPAKLDDDHALRWSVSTLLALRRATGPGFKGRVVVEARRAAHVPLLKLTGEAGLAGATVMPLDVFASDDIVARVLAQSIRQGGVYFALRELLSFRGAELYLEKVPEALVGKTFDEAHAAVERGIAAGILFADGRHELAPRRHNEHRLGADEHLIVIEEDHHVFALGGALPRHGRPAPPAPIARVEARRVVIVGANRTLPRLVVELDRIMSPGATLVLSSPPLTPDEEAAVRRAIGACRRVRVERVTLEPSHLENVLDPSLLEADGVVILGCEDELDPDGDASALAILLTLRHARRSHGYAVERLVTEVRDPARAQQIAGSPDDFLVSNDVVAMVLAQACLEPRLADAYRELLDPTGVEIYLVPRSVYVPDGDVTFGEVMAAARQRNEIAIGFFPWPRGDARAVSPEVRIQEGKLEVDEQNPVLLNPPRGMIISEGPGASIVVLADPPEAPEDYERKDLGRDLREGVDESRSMSREDAKGGTRTPTELPTET